MSLASNFQKEPALSSKYARAGEKSQQRLVPSLNYKLRSKENAEDPIQTCPSFRAREGTPELKRGREDITEKLKQIRKKYENQLAVNKSSIDRTTSPLKELNGISKTPRYPEAEAAPNAKPTIQRTFSFINIESVESKPETVRYQEESFVEPVGERGAFGEWKTKEFLTKKPTGEPQSTTNMFSVKQERQLDGRKYSYTPYERKTAETDLAKLRQRYSKDSYSSKPYSNSVSKEVKPIDNPEGNTVEVNGQRIDSIDKINVRIKEILKSINESEIPAPKGQAKVNYNTDLPIKPVAKPVEVIKPPPLKFDYSKARQETTAVARHNASCYPNSDHIYNKTENNGDQPIKNESKTARYSIPRSTIKSELEVKADAPVERPLTLRYNVSATTTTREPSVGLPARNSSNVRSIKDLDQEIQRIQQKIKHSEEEKKRLWNEGSNPPAIERASVYNSKQAAEEIKRSYQNDDKLSKYTPTSRMESKHESRQEPYQPDKVTEEFLAEKYRNCRYSAPMESALEARSTFTVTSQSNSLMLKPPTDTSNRDRIEELRSRTQHTHRKSFHDAHQEGIPKAEKLTFKIVPVAYDAESDLPRDCQQTRKFIEALKQQVSLDEELRNAKIWLDNADVPNKWEAVRNELAKHHINMSLQEVEKHFTNSLEEHNPFFTMKNYHESIATVVEKYLTSQNLWQQALKKKFNAELLKKERFEQDRLDLERKGFLTVEDFVRFLNIETGTFYRNRDLVLLFRRLTQQQKLTFSEFISKVTN